MGHVARGSPVHPDPYANFGPPPSLPEAMAVIALAFYAMLALLAAWIERIAVASDLVKRAH